MTDKELLEAAARAAGYISATSDGGVFVIFEDFEPRDWNPLTNDADAMRLAVKLERFSDARFWFKVVELRNSFDFGVNELAATRRAIVRAAAAMDTLTKCNTSRTGETIDALRGALDAPLAEPVMIYHGRCVIDCGEYGHQDVTMLKMIATGSKLYTHPPVQPSPLTDEEVRAEFAKQYPRYSAILELAKHNRHYRDYAVEAIDAQNCWVAFEAGARAMESIIRSKL